MLSCTIEVDYHRSNLVHSINAAWTIAHSGTAITSVKVHVDSNQRVTPKKNLCKRTQLPNMKVRMSGLASNVAFAAGLYQAYAGTGTTSNPVR